MSEMHIFLFVFIGLVSTTECSRNYELLMSNVTTQKANSYMHKNFELPSADKRMFITGIAPKANSSVVHHIILSGCNRRRPASNHIDCPVILYSWAHSGPDLNLPPGIGFEVGMGTSILSFQLEIHYLPPVSSPDQSGVTLSVTDERQPKCAGVMTLGRSHGSIPSGKGHTNLDISCRLQSNAPITIIGLRAHTHDLGRLVIGFVVNQSSPRNLNLLGRIDPQWPQTFYPMASVTGAGRGVISQSIEPNDYLMARCLYDSRQERRARLIGSSHIDEMCNLYLLYYTQCSALLNGQSSFCADDEFPDLWSVAPKDSVVYDEAGKLSTPPVNSNCLLCPVGNNQLTPLVQFDRALKLNLSTHEGISAIASASASPRQVDYQPTLPGLLVAIKNRDVGEEEEVMTSLSPFQQSTAPHSLDTSPASLLLVNPTSGQIERRDSPTLGLVNPSSIAFDSRLGSVWLTDLDRGQTIQLNWTNWREPSLSIGQWNEAGNYQSNVGSPIAVTLDSKGFIYVVDGVRKSRIVKFSPSGSFVKHWSVARLVDRLLLPPSDFDSSNRLLLVTSIVTIPAASLQDGKREERICVNACDLAGVLCFSLDGELTGHYTESRQLPNIVSLTYCKQRDLLIGLTTKLYDSHEHETYGFMLSPFEASHGDRHLMQSGQSPIQVTSSSRLTGFFAVPQPMAFPISLTVSHDGQFLHAAPVWSRQIYQFRFVNRSPQSQGHHQSLVSYYLHKLAARSFEPSQIIGLTMLLVIALVVLIVALTPCCRASLNLTRCTNRANSKGRGGGGSNWLGRPRVPTKFGFQLLNQYGSDDEDDRVGGIRTKGGKSKFTIPQHHQNQHEDVVMSREALERIVQTNWSTATNSRWNTPTNDRYSSCTNTTSVA